MSDHDKPSDSSAGASPLGEPSRRLCPSPKISRSHHDRLALIYVRQSTLQQVADHKESLARQYALTQTAVALGWPADRTTVIDEDLGLSGRGADQRPGFQRLLSEVALDHVGMVLGLEMSRLSRSCKDWHHLLELCAVFGTLLADQDGVYDPRDPNDRLLLGLRGTISEVELHTMRNRLDRGRLHKAERAELFSHHPVGYIKSPTGRSLEFDPDEQVRGVVQLLFDKFEELGSAHGVFRYLLRHGIRIGIRPHNGPTPGQLEWRQAKISTVMAILKHPFYAGAYAYGRQPVGVKGRGRRWVPMEQWQVLRRDRLPAYITWEQYLRNLERLRQNRARQEATGCPRGGPALLQGLVVCGQCGLRLRVGSGRYQCLGGLNDSLQRTCNSLTAARLDALVTEQVLRALEPASLELSLQASEDIQRERQRLTRHWEQRRERARHDVREAERSYRAVDAENRLVARTLERQWEEALRQQRQVEEAYEGFCREKPSCLSDAERGQIRALSEDIPALWAAAHTTVVDRKAVIRALVQRIVVEVRGDSDRVGATVHWQGGNVTRHTLRRTVARYDRLQDYDRLVERIVQAKREGLTAEAIAERLNEEGFQLPTEKSERFNRDIVVQLFRRIGLSRARRHQERLRANEWWFRDLAEQLEIHPGRLRHWLDKGYVHTRKARGGHYVIVWADRDELVRLRKLREYLATEHRCTYPEELTTPKPRKT